MSCRLIVKHLIFCVLSTFTAYIIFFEFFVLIFFLILKSCYSLHSIQCMHTNEHTETSHFISYYYWYNINGVQNVPNNWIKMISEWLLCTHGDVERQGESLTVGVSASVFDFDASMMIFPFCHSTLLSTGCSFHSLSHSNVNMYSTALSFRESRERTVIFEK